jgi:hypothetical protein
LRSETIPPHIANIVADIYDFLRLPPYDPRKDSIDNINGQVSQMLDELKTTPNTITSTSESDISSEHEELSDISDHAEYIRDTPTHIDESAADFEREFQAMMIESVTEGRARRNEVQSNALVVTPTTPQQGSSEIGTFRVMSKNSTQATILVPETSKLIQSQERYKAELEAAARERAFLKRYILDYQRQEDRGSSRPPPSLETTSAFPSLGEYDEFRAPESQTVTTRYTRRKYRKV